MPNWSPSSIPIARARRTSRRRIRLPGLCRPCELAGRVDAAIVAVPTSAHAETACALMDAGIDVLVEKPIAPDLASARRLIEAAPSAGRILQVGHLERFNPAVAALHGDPAAAVLRSPPPERVHAAQPGCGRGAGPDDSRPRHRALAGRREPEEIRAAGISDSVRAKWTSPTCGWPSRPVASRI